jgi:iron(III) transport system ATP-binding protein
MTPIRIEGLAKRFGETVALDEVDLDITQGEIFFLLGPSGCGKTTLLRILAGLETADSGRVLFGDRDVTRMPARHREAVMVFQGYALWPHMTVEKNVEFGLDVRGAPRAERARAVADALEQVRLAALAGRRPGQLSGGQQQRVALARALVVRPRVLLLDEPLSNLDAGLRMQMRTEIRTLCKRVGLTALYVTHDQHEALAVADRIALMREGVVEQVGTPREIYRRPLSRFAAEFMGEANLFEATVDAAAGGFGLSSEIGHLAVSSLPEGTRAGDRVLCSVRPECWRLDEPGAGGVEATVVRVTFLGERTEVLAEADHLAVKVFKPGAAGADLEPGRRVELRVHPDDVVVLPASGEGP